jgi:hypothetical protein
VVLAVLVVVAMAALAHQLEMLATQVYPILVVVVVALVQVEVPILLVQEALAVQE